MKIRKLYLITLIQVIIFYIICIIYQKLAEIKCEHFLELGNDRYNSCVRSMSNPGGFFEIFSLIVGIFIIFSVAGLISDGLHFIVRKIKNMFYSK